MKQYTHDDLEILVTVHQIRKEKHNGEWYYCAVDVVAAIRNVDVKRAQNYYHVLKQRGRELGELFPQNIVTLKSKARDGKSYNTDFIDRNGVILLSNVLGINRTKSELRKQHGGDEVVNFHPQVINYLQKDGWYVQQHVGLPLGGIIDIVAQREQDTWIIECKPKLKRSHLYLAIGQVLCYRAEYDINATPVIAHSYNQSGNYAQVNCELLGIKLLHLPYS